MNYYCKYIKRGNLEVTNTFSDWEKVIWIFNSILHPIGVSAFLRLDYFYQKIHAENYESLSDKYKNYQGENPCQAELSRRLAPWARLASPIEYDYDEVFLLAFVKRIVYIYGTLKLDWLPTLICSYFDNSKYAIRPVSVKEEKDEKKEKDIAHKMVPWMERFSLAAADLN